jgi:hypothetical protein
MAAFLQSPGKKAVNNGVETILINQYVYIKSDKDMVTALSFPISVLSQKQPVSRELSA